MADRARVGILGGGRLGAAVAGRLAATMDTVPVAAGTAPAELDLIVVAADGAHETPAPATAPWLPVRVELGTAVIGPAALPGTAGCPACARTRARRARADAQQRRAARDRFTERYETPDVRLTCFGLTVTADLVAEEVASLRGGNGARTRGGVIHVGLDTLTTSVHRFLPDPHCAICGGLPDDTADAAVVPLTPNPKLAPDTYRVRDLRPDLQQLLDLYVDRELGLIRGLYRTTFGTYPTMSAPMGLHTDSEEIESGFGRTLDFRSSQLTAIAEAVERHGGMRPGGKRTVTRGSHRQLAADAVDPATLGLYPDDRYALPGFPFQRYHPDLELPWVWGYSFARGAPVLVPESYAYYGMHTHAHGETVADRPLVYEISNGCALGGSLEEAILYGILELAERDAFLLTWYARLPVRELDLDTAADRRIPLMAERLRHDLGYEPHVFDITTEHGIPAVWVMGVHPSDDGTAPKMLCAAGASFDPERAITSALMELAPILEMHLADWPDIAGRAAAMVEDPDQVRVMQDHSIINAHTAAFPRMGFLFERGSRVPVAESFAGTFRPRNHDLTADLRATVARYLDRGQDVVVVDQTAPEHAAGGFACVKVIIPGLLPMTFGHRLRRVDGLPRLYEVPRLLGYTSAPLRPADVNPDPHPFP